MQIGSPNPPPSGGGYWPRYDYLAFYSRILGTPLVPKKYPYYVTLCPFHNDKNNPNLRVNILSGNYKCFACGQAGGAHNFVVRSLEGGQIDINFPDHIRDEAQIQQIEAYEKSREFSEESEELILAIEEQRAKKSHEFLFQQPFALQILQRDRGLTEESIREWHLGWMNGTVTIPIPDITGKLANLKFHKKFSTDHAKNQLFPWKAVTQGSTMVIIVEGEFDMMLMRQHGFNAVTQTFGANTWNDEFTTFFRRKTVFIAYDNDEPGRKAAIDLGKRMMQERISAFIVKWPEFMGVKEDHLDFFLKHKKTADDYRKLLNQAASVITL